MNSLLGPGSAALAAGLLACGGTAACDGLRADGGWLRQPPPGAGSAAGYVLLMNAGDRPMTVRGVSSPAFARGMIHETRYSEGRAEMRHLHEIVIAPGAQIEARPGGMHLMLSEPKQPLALGDMIEIHFDCASGDPLITWLPVRRTAPDS
ncbi:MAG: copper chaperone PCu(A)C [Gammaproteobacteria bacterium]